MAAKCGANGVGDIDHYLYGWQSPPDNWSASVSTLTVWLADSASDVSSSRSCPAGISPGVLARNSHGPAA